MKILLAPDSFKSSLSSKEICNILATELKCLPGTEIVSSPQSDGGEGSLETISFLPDLEEVALEVSDPLGKKIIAKYLINKNEGVAYIESAMAYGLTLLKPGERSCINTSSYGTGELIKHALDQGAGKIIIFIGGSSGNDAGTGLCSALGYKFLDKTGNRLPGSGVNLQNISRIDDTEYICKNSDIKFIAACDVNNPFYGPEGAARVYAKQKGATEEEIKMLDNGMKHIAGIVMSKYNIDLQNIPGSGAAGGLGGGIYVFLNGDLTSGADLIADLTCLDNYIVNTDLVITGEGVIDNQTLSDKLVKKICDRAKKFNKPVWTVCGFFNGDKKLQSKLGIEKNFSLAKTKNEINSSINNPGKYLINTCKKIKKEIIINF